MGRPVPPGGRRPVGRPRKNPGAPTAPPVVKAPPVSKTPIADLDLGCLHRLVDRAERLLGDVRKRGWHTDQRTTRVHELCAGRLSHAGVEYNTFQAWKEAAAAVDLWNRGWIILQSGADTPASNVNRLQRILEAAVAVEVEAMRIMWMVNDVAENVMRVMLGTREAHVGSIDWDLALNPVD